MKILRKKTLFLPVVLFVFISLSIRGQNNPDDCSLMRTQPYLQMPSTNSMVVRWVTKFSCIGEIEYSTAPDLSSGVNRISSTEASLTHKFKLTNLVEGKKYYYRVRSTLPQCNGESGTELSDIHSFSTIDTNNTEYKILVLNDLHPGYTLYWNNNINQPVYEKIQGIVRNLDYDLTVFNGDVLDGFQKEADMIWWIDQFNRWVRNDAIPSVYLMGNHEYDGVLAGETNHSHQNMALKKYLDYVKDGQTYGKLQVNKNTELLFLDTGKHIDTCKYFEDLYGSQQKYVMDSISPYKSKNRILFHHIPFFGQGDTQHYNALNAEELNNANVLLAVNGHIHQYQKIAKADNPNGTNRYWNNYPVLIADGPPSNRAPASGYIRSVILIHINGDELHLTCYLIKEVTYEIVEKKYKIENGEFKSPDNQLTN